MTQRERFHLIQGTLLDRQNILHDVELVIVTKSKSDRKGTEEEPITMIEFARRSPVPDGGPYTLQFVFNGKEHKDPVRVKSGKLAMA